MRPVYNVDLGVSYLASVAITHGDHSGPRAQDLIDVTALRKEVWIKRIVGDPKRNGWHEVYLCPYGYEVPTNPVLIGVCARLRKYKGRSIPKSENKVRQEAKNKGKTQKQLRAEKRARSNGTARLDKIAAETARRNKLERFINNNQPKTIIRGK